MLRVLKGLEINFDDVFMYKCNVEGVNSKEILFNSLGKFILIWNWRIFF